MEARAAGWLYRGLVRAGQQVSAKELRASWHEEVEQEAGKAAHARRSENRKTRMQELEKAWDAKLNAVEDKIHRSTEAARARHEEHAKRFARFVEQQKASYRELFA